MCTLRVLGAASSLGRGPGDRRPDGKRKIISFRGYGGQSWGWDALTDQSCRGSRDGVSFGHSHFFDFVILDVICLGEYLDWLEKGYSG